MIDWKKIKPNVYYRVDWLDIQNHTNDVLTKPYIKQLAKSFTIGTLRKDKDALIVAYGGNDDKDESYDAIPLKVITNITKII